MKNVKIMEVNEFDDLVKKTYGRPYSFQQQDNCKERGTEYFTVPVPAEYVEDYENESIPEKINGLKMGVSFKAWLERDPEKQIPGCKEKWELSMFWERNFYPKVEMIINDLHSKGLLEAGEYGIAIDW